MSSSQLEFLELSSIYTNSKYLVKDKNAFISSSWESLLANVKLQRKSENLMPVILIQKYRLRKNFLTFSLRNFLVA